MPRTKANPHTRETILASAINLMATFGYRKTTMEEIAREAGIGKGTLYLHFENKEAIALAMAESLHAGLMVRVSEMAQTDGAPADRIRSILVTCTLHNFDRIYEFRSGLDELFREVREPLLDMRDSHSLEVAMVVADVLREGAAEDTMHFDDAETTAEVLVTAFEALQPHALSPQRMEDRGYVETLAIRLAALMTRALER